MIRETLAVGLLGCNCTILGDEVSHEAIVIDPGYDIPRIMAVLVKHHLNLKQIVVTHAHIDHIASAQSLKALTAAPILYSKKDLPLVALMDVQASWLGLAVPDVKPPDHSPEDDERVHINGIEGKILLTPGHSEGSLCLYIASENLLLAGDTLFAGSVGRTDFPGGNMDKLMGSLADRILQLPDETTVVPGHGVETSIGRERRENPFLK